MAAPVSIVARRSRRSPPETSKFTDLELEAAVNLVLLSESSSCVGGSAGFGDTTAGRGRSSVNRSSCCSSSSSSVNNADNRIADEDEAIDEELTGPWARSQRYRSLCDVYASTVPIDRTIAAARAERLWWNKKVGDEYFSRSRNSSSSAVATKKKRNKSGSMTGL